MGRFIAQRTIKEMIHAGVNILGSQVTVLGLTFKENCPDLRNSRVIDVIQELREFGIEVQVCDPQADVAEALEEYGISLVPFVELKPADAVIVTVAHQQFTSLSIADYQSLLRSSPPVLIDVKGVVNRDAALMAGMRFWRL